MITCGFIAWQPGKVLNGLNARQSKISPIFHSKILSNFLMVFDVFLEMQNDSKNYVSVQDDEITELFNELLQKASFEPNEKMRCLFGIAKRF